jgi:hypothetical protein
MAKQMKRNEMSAVESGGLGTSGFTLGIVSIILAGWLGLITGIIGFSFCMVQQKKNPSKLGRIGKILNIIGVVISIALLIVTYYYLLPMISQ